MDTWMAGTWMNGWMDGACDGWMDGWMENDFCDEHPRQHFLTAMLALVHVRRTSINSERVPTAKLPPKAQTTPAEGTTGAGPLITAADFRFRTATSRRSNRSLSHSQHLRIFRRYVLVPPSLLPHQQQAVPFIYCPHKAFLFRIELREKSSQCDSFSSAGRISREVARAWGGGGKARKASGLASVEPEGSRLALRRAPYQKLPQQPGSRPGPHHFGAGSHCHQQRSINVLRIGRQPLASPKFSERKIIFARHWILFSSTKA